MPTLRARRLAPARPFCTYLAELRLAAALLAGIPGAVTIAAHAWVVLTGLAAALLPAAALLRARLSLAVIMLRMLLATLLATLLILTTLILTTLVLVRHNTLVNDVQQPPR